MTFDEMVAGLRQAEWDATTNAFLAKRRAKVRRTWAGCILVVLGLMLAGSDGEWFPWLNVLGLLLAVLGWRIGRLGR